MNAPDGMRMRESKLGAQAREPRPSLGVPVLAPLLDERAQVELVGGEAGGHHHEQAADDERVADDDRRRAVRRQLGCPEPFEQGEADAHERERPRTAQRRAAELQQDHERRLVCDVVGEDVARLVAQDRAQLLAVEQLDGA